MKLGQSAVFISLLALASAQLLNRKVDRLLDISSQTVTITSKITFENLSQKPVSEYLVTFDQDHELHLAYISATMLGADKSKNNLPVVKQSDGAGWRIDLGNEFKVAPGSTSALLEVEAVFTHLLSPYPTHIAQADRQMVMYTGSHYMLSPYETKSQSTKVKLPTSGSLESYTKLKPSSAADRSINLGPYENVPAKGSSKLQVHVENNSPFLVATSLDRAIEVSHWAAMVTVEETVELRHDGAILKGPFSRYEFQREPTNGISSVKSFKSRLPATAQDVYYRDEIGNISTSNVRQTMSSVVAELRPRFPLFGGWQTHYVLGYSLPALDYLFSDGSQYALKIPFVEQMFEHMVVDEARMTIVLPEGASDIKLRLPYPIVREKDGLQKTYLDTIGRPVIVLKKSNLVGQHIQDLEVHYKFNKMLMLAEPMLLVGALFLLCLLVIVYVRLDFSLAKNPAKESTQKVCGVIERILKYQDKRSALYEDYDRMGARFKSSKDGNQYQATLKRLNAEHKNHTGHITDLITKLKADGATPELAEKVLQLQKLDKNLKEQIGQQNTLLEKLVAGKMSKQLYLDTDANIGKKKEELVDKIESIVNCL